MGNPWTISERMMTAERFCRPCLTGLGREDGNPFHATDFILEEGRWEAVDAFLGVIVEDLNNFFWEEDITCPVGLHG